jgi:transposase
MPWLETSPMEGRERFIRDHRLDLYPMRELCARYGISRKTGYKWLMRFEDAGRRGLQDRSRAPHQCPHRIAEDVADMICAAHALTQHPVGLEEVDDGIWSIHFCHVLLGRVDERDYIIRA